MNQEKQYDLKEILNYIDPAMLEYQDWVNVGMCLKDAGYTAADWDNWSKRDPARYHQGEGKGFQHVGTWQFDAAKKLIDRIAGNGWRVPRDINPSEYKGARGNGL